MAQQGENIKGLQEWFDDQMNRYLSNGGKIEDLDPNSQLAHTPDLLRKLGVELNEARDKKASIEQDIATLTSEIASLDEQIKEVDSKKDEPVVPNTPTTPDKPETPVTPTTDTKPSESAQTDTNGQAAYHEVVTKAETQKVIDRRGIPTYQATAELPNTGDDNTATFTLMGLAITAMGMFGAIKLKGRKDC